MKFKLKLQTITYSLIALLGGVLMGLTPAPVGAFPLAWVAFIPLWLLAINSPVKLTIWYGMLWAFAYHGLAIFWITGVHPMTWLGVPWLASLAIAIFCWLAIVAWGLVFITVWAVLFKVLTRGIKPNLLTQCYRVLVGVALWCGLEALWSFSPLWWSSLSYTQSPNNLWILQLLKVSGSTTVTAIIVAFNGFLGEFIQAQFVQRQRLGSSRGLLGIALSLLIVLHGVGAIIYNRPLNDTNPFKVGIIQGNIPNTIKLFTDGKQRAMMNYTRGYEKLASQGVDAVLLPETALPFFISQIPETAFFQALLNKGVLAWIGAYGTSPENPDSLDYTNSVFTLAGDGEVLSRYDKVKLVPLGEYIPFESVLGAVINRLSPLNAAMIPGTRSQTFDTPFGRAIVGICYESAFPELFLRQAQRGGEFILTASNNAHYSETMPAQHHAQDVLRAVESDRWAIRATNTGYSGIVDPHGRTLWLSGINTYEVHAETVYPRQTRTLYVRWGDWLVWLLLGGMGVSAIAIKYLDL